MHQGSSARNDEPRLGIRRGSARSSRTRSDHPGPCPASPRTAMPTLPSKNRAHHVRTLNCYRAQSLEYCNRECLLQLMSVPPLGWRLVWMAAAVAEAHCLVSISSHFPAQDLLRTTEETCDTNAIRVNQSTQPYHPPFHCHAHADR